MASPSGGDDSKEEIRPGRSIGLRRTKANTGGQHYDSRTVCLFVHGACAHMNQWRSQQPVLTAAGVSTVAYDALGCGESDKPRSWDAYHPEELYQDLCELFDQETKGYERVLVVGHSFGASLCLRLASEKQVAAVALIGAYVPVENLPKPSLFSLARWLFYLPNWVLHWLQPDLTEGFLQAAFHPATQASKPELVDQERKASNSNPPYMFKAFHRQASRTATLSEHKQWGKRLTQPVAVVYGEADAITPLSPHSTALMSHLPRATLTVVPDASHQVMQEQPEKVNAAILSLLAEIAS